MAPLNTIDKTREYRLQALIGRLKQFFSFSHSIIIFCFFVCCPQSIPAQSNYSFPKWKQPKPRYIVDPITNKKNLQSTDISALFQDEDGFIWIGNQPGVSRYDGFDFLNFSKAGDTYIGQIHDIVQDHLGVIWIGGVNGLFYYTQGQIYPTKIDKHSIRCLHLDREQRLLIGGIDFYPFFLSGEDLEKLKQGEEVVGQKLLDAAIWDIRVIDKNIWEIDTDPNGVIWIGTDYQLLSIEGGKVQIHIKDRADRGEYKGILALGADSIYWGAEDKGAHLLSKEQSKRITAPATYIFEHIDTSIFFLTTMDILEYHNGIMDTLHVFTTYAHLYFKEMIRDAEGNFWVGAQGELLKFTPTYFYSWSIDNTSLLHSNHSITELPNTEIIIGSSKENILKFEQGDFKVFTTVDAPFNSANTAILPIDNEAMWIATSMGGLIKKTKIGQEQYSKTQGLGDKVLYCLFQDSKGILWTSGENVIAKVSEINGEVKFQNFLANIAGEQAPLLHTIFESSAGDIWAASDKGLFAIRNEQLTRYSFDAPHNPHPILTSAFKDGENLWLSTQGEGLWQCRMEKNSDPVLIKQWTTSHGLISDVVLNVHVDKLGRVWPVHQNGLCQINFQQDSAYILQYGVNDGWSDEPSSQSKILESSNGWLWAVGNTSVTTFPLYGLPTNQKRPKPFITQISLFEGKENIYKYADNDQLSGSLPENLILPSNKNFLRFKFTTTSHTKSTKNKFLYQLKGLENRWNEGGADRTVTYSGLPPGAYVFQIKALNNDGLLSSKAATFRFKILSPWYLRWWAIVSFSLLIISLIYLLYRNRLRSQYAQQESLRLKELDAFKTRFYANITHEFRTPLTVIRGMTDELYEKPKEKPRQKLALIRRNSQSLLDLINQMLSLSKLQAGGLELDLRQQDIIKYLGYLVESYESYARSQGISLQFYSEEESLVMDMDVQKLERILLNLIANAIKFTPEHGKILIVTKCLKVAGEQHLRIMVKDNGVGIKAKDIPYIFDPYRQGEGQQSHYGTGLGLALVKELVELMKGRVEVQSEPGTGTRFYIYLPIRKDAPKAKNDLYQKSNKLQKSQRSSEEITSNDPIKEDLDQPVLLLIEDNADVAFYIQNCLNTSYQVVHQQDGKSGLEKAFELIPDIIISDVMMPEMDGFEVCKRLKRDERTNHIPIILLTAKASAEDKLVGLEYGADAYLTKPFDKVELLMRLDKLLEIRKTLHTKYSALSSGDQRSNTDLPGIVSAGSANNKKHLFLQKAEDIILAELDNEDLSINELSRQLHLSTSQVYRKIKALSGMSTAIFIRHVRLCEARDLLINEDLGIAEVAYRTGFRSPVYFSQAFKETFGASPSTFQKR